MECSRLSDNDAVFVFSVGGGSKEKNKSVNLVKALELAKSVGSKILGFIGRDGGYTKKVANHCLLIPILNKKNTTAITESFQSIIWHLLVSHPDLKKNSMKWESILK